MDISGYYSDEAEKTTLSAMLFSREDAAAACGALTGADFYRPENRAMFEAISRLNAAGEPPDVTLIARELKAAGAYDKIGGMEYLAKIAAFASTSAYLTHYCAELRRLSAARGVYASVQDMARKAEILTIDDLRAALEAAENGQHVKSYADNAMAAIDEYRENVRAKKERVTTGFAVLDGITGGMRLPSTAIIGAYPSVGKTAFALNIAMNQAGPVVFFSLEMSREMIYERLASAALKLDYGRFTDQSLSEGQYRAVEGFMDELKRRQFYVFDNVIYVEQQAQIAAGIKPRLIVVDYIQKVRTRQRTESKRHEIDYISGFYKQIAKNNNCVVLILSQLARSAQGRPTMQSLKESGALEADGDLIGILHRPYVTNKDEPDRVKPEDGYLLIDKNKFGGTGKISLYFKGEHQQFYEAFKPKSDGGFAELPVYDDREIPDEWR